MTNIPKPVLIIVIVVAIVIAALGAKSLFGGDSRYDKAKIESMQKGAKGQGGHDDAAHSPQMDQRR